MRALTFEPIENKTPKRPEVTGNAEQKNKEEMVER